MNFQSSFRFSPYKVGEGAIEGGTNIIDRNGITIAQANFGLRLIPLRWEEIKMIDDILSRENFDNTFKQFKQFKQEEQKSIFKFFKEKYASIFREDIVDLRIVQSPSTVWLEITKQLFSDSQDQIIYKIDLSFIKNANTKQQLFLPKNTIEDNSNKFLNECQTYLINAAFGEYLFSNKAYREMLLNDVEKIDSSQWQLL